MKYVDVEDPKIGDIATRRDSELDPRAVADVSADGSMIRLRIGGTHITDEVPADLYTFERKVFEVDEKVVYRPAHLPIEAQGEEGIVTQDNGGPYVFVRYGNDTWAKSTPREFLRGISLEVTR